MSEPAQNTNDKNTSTGTGTARLAWSLWILSLAIAASGLVLLALNWSSPVPARWGFRGFQSLFNIPIVTVGAIIAWRRPRNPIGWILLTSGFFGVLTGFGEEYATYALVTRSGSLPGGTLIAGLGNWLWLPSMGLIGIHASLLFPNGCFLAPRWRIAAWLGAAWIVLGSLRFAIEPGPLENLSFVSNPFGNEKLATRMPWLSLNATLGIGLLLMGLAALSLILRYWQSGGEVRQQIKWVAYAAALIPFAGIVGQFDGLIPDLFLFLIAAALPVAFGIAILRYRLYDIDLLINRTLVYGALTASVAALYVLVIGGLGLLFRSSDNLLIPLLATGLAAVLFQPLRQRLQGAVNRMMYGERDDPVAVITKLGEQIENTGTPEATLFGIVETVAQTLKLPYVAIELGDNNEIAASYGIRVNEPLRLPLIYQGEAVGCFVIARRAREGSFTPKELQLLENIARQAGAAAHNARLTADLQRARQRLVTAREEERRRIRRDLHDGLGPQLASQTLTLTAARRIYKEDPQAADRLLAEAIKHAQAATEDIRRLVHDLRPPALDNLGLIGAIKTQIEKFKASGIQISMDIPGALPPLPAAVEAACYMICHEALNNVTRHSGASHCTVTLTLEKELCLKIRDDGQGVSQDHRSGVGLASMRQRAEELGGAFKLDSISGNGACLTACFPMGISED